MLLNPKTETFAHLDPASREIMRKTVDFFETKGKKKLLEEYHERTWYDDFIEFFNPDKFAEIPRKDDPADDTFLFDQGPTKGLGKIRFHDYHIAYDSVDLPNVRIFRGQIDALKDMLMTAAPEEDQTRDIDFLLSLGELFSLVAYGQLVIIGGRTVVGAIRNDEEHVKNAEPTKARWASRQIRVLLFSCLRHHSGGTEEWSSKMTGFISA